MRDIRSLEKITNVSQIKLRKHVCVREIFIGFCAEQSGDWKEAVVTKAPERRSKGFYDFTLDYVQLDRESDRIKINPCLIADEGDNIIDMGFGFDYYTKKITHPKYELK
ncbi:MAG: hypothetical protein AABY22_11415, partial [Nanoarchaeota archaeon]